MTPAETKPAIGQLTASQLPRMKSTDDSGLIMPNLVQLLALELEPSCRMPLARDQGVMHDAPSVTTIT
ncbi:hypothetical protein HETIRDRAFT_442185 [Heterobasidion irregulare TC 32-1]|uniref:Uncharacterized protein n=1 Tax=Heterobasidion irregulare (strain TC 32-1) TaxID=747525 RepID=W4JRD7_HETIT|nr:uncharacterized protein HETIRDRAFT_442185 [Heterobasidion irregulare TC 32-1]ETW75650.1 hypothetical protein HETIRDRAFT_442185 [Heterobasidion irregulare TC 32-1]